MKLPKQACANLNNELYQVAFRFRKLIFDTNLDTAMRSCVPSYSYAKTLARNIAAAIITLPSRISTIMFGKDTDKVLVYEKYSDRKHDQPYTMTSKELSEFLEQSKLSMHALTLEVNGFANDGIDPHLQATTKDTSGDSHTTVYQKDTYTAQQKEMYNIYP